MIEKMHLAKVGAYDAGGSSLENLKAVNFIFGPNGSGKTTISRLINAPESYTDCSVKWNATIPLETRVYNRDFVEKHFDAASSIKGIYTFGENIEVADKIAALKIDTDKISGKLAGLNTQLNGENGDNGKQKEQDDLSNQLVEDVWTAKKNLDDISDAFSGLNNNKRNFRDRYLYEAENNQAALRDIGELRRDATTVFSSTLTEAATVPQPISTELVELESNAILTKKIMGKEDVDIAALIEKLGNSDWVQQGREYFDALDEQCPFCQQKTDAAFRQSIEEYFDEGYIADLAAIDQLLENYASKVSSLLESYSASATMESAFLDRDSYEKDVTALRLTLNRNLELIKAKRKEPSTPVTLENTKALFAAVNGHIEAANEKVKENNETLHDLDARKNRLSSEIWKRLLVDSGPTYAAYKSANDTLDKAISSIKEQLEKLAVELDAKNAEIEENERKITSIKPTIDEINKLLKSFGFVNFYLIESTETGFYEVKRPGGEDAKSTLSEGEKSFITFLYFYHLIRGSFSASGATTDRIVVFDDPVSSLDADILFIVCNLIKGIIADMRDGNSAIKQVFVLTHNIYFHKEVTFNKNRNGANAFKYETFWIIRKASDRSEVIPCPENPIKSSYELLWHEVRQKPPSDTAIQNVMRRILEHYFKFFGGVTPEHIIDKFQGQEKLICGSLFSWVNDGSHFANDDLFMSCDPGQVDRYLVVFQKIFEMSDHGGHFKMMMGDDYVALPTLDEGAETPPAVANDMGADTASTGVDTLTAC